MAVFWRNGCAALSLALFCLCVWLFISWYVFYPRCRITRDAGLLLFPWALKCMQIDLNVSDVKSASFWEIAPADVKRHHMNSKFYRIVPSFPSTKPISAAHRDSVCSVRWQPGLKHGRFTQYHRFPSFSPHMFSTSPLFLSACLCLHWKKETYVPVQRETH